MATTITANGINFPDGSAGSPSIGGTDTNTGLFTGSDIVGFATGGSERLRIDASGNINIANDSGKLQLGTSADLKFFHDGSNSYIKNETGDLFIQCTGGTSDDISLEATDNIFLKVSGNEAGIYINGDAGVELYYDNSKKLETTSSGVSVTGGQTITSYGGTTGLGQLNFGASGTPNIKAWDTGNHGSGSKLQIRSGDGDTHIECNRDGNVELYYDNSLRYFTRSNGGTIQGTSSNVGIDFSTDGSHRGTVYANSSNQIGFLDTGGDWAIRHTNDSQTEFYVQTNRKAAIDADGLKFGTDTAAANALDDYEEGTWTVTMNKAGTSGNADSQVHTRAGYYIKVGDLLWVSFYWYSSNLSFGSGAYQWYVSGLPFNLLTTISSAHQFIPGGYQYNNGTMTAYNSGNYRWQANNINGAATLAMYGNMMTSNASGGGWEWSGCGCLRVA